MLCTASTDWMLPPIPTHPTRRDFALICLERRTTDQVLVSDFEVPKSYAIVICSAGMVRLSTQNTLCLLQTNNHNKTETKQQNNEHNTQQKLQKPKTPTLYQNPVCLISHSTLHCHWYINNRSPVSPAGKKSFFFVLADVGFWVQGSGSPGNDVGHGPGATDFLPTPYHSGVNAFNMPRVF
jgi:hypothetical protein